MRKRTIAAVAAAIAAMLALGATPALAANSGGHLTMYRLYNPYTGEHFYTADESERDRIAAVGWRPEGTGWVAPERSSTPVYRLYNSYVKGGDHHYTTDRAEYDHLVKVGWTGEGVGWYSDDERGLPLHRLYNPYARTGTHHYTLDEAERDSVAAAGWRREGVAWYGVDTERLAAREQARLEYEEAEAELSARQADADSAAGALAASEGAAAALRDDLAGAEAEVEESSKAVAAAKASVAATDKLVADTNGREPMKTSEVRRIESLGSLGFFQSLGEGGKAAADVLLNPAEKVAPYQDLAAPGDPTSLANLRATVPHLRRCNELRTMEPHPGSGEMASDLLVSPYLMAVAEVQLNWSSEAEIGHSHAYNVGENLAWGYSDLGAFDGWYFREKEQYNNGITDFHTIGHYLNIINTTYGTSGYAVRTKMENSLLNGSSYGQTFSVCHIEGELEMTVDEFEAALNAYCSPVIRFEEEHASWEAELETCQSERDSAVRRLDEVMWKHTMAVDGRDQISTWLNEANAQLKRDREASEAAQAALKQAQQKADAARKKYESYL